MGNKSGKQRVSKKGKSDEQPKENENKPEEKPENGPTTATEKTEDKTVDQPANESGQDGTEGDGGGGTTEDTADQKPETENKDNVVDDAAKEVTTTESDNKEKEQPDEQPGDSSVVPTDTQPSDSTVQDKVETETPLPDGVDDSGEVHKDEPANVVVDDSSSKEIVEDTTVTNGDQNDTEVPSTEKETDGGTNVGDDVVETPKEEEVQNGDPSKDVQIEVTPPVPDEVATNGTEETQDKPDTTDPDTTDPDLEKQDDLPPPPPTTEQPSELTDETATKYPVEFKWEDAGETVLVSGTFNEWNDKIELEKNDDVFIAKMELPAGEYLYKYFVDEQWVINKNQPIKTDDEGTENNVLIVESAG